MFAAKSEDDDSERRRMDTKEKEENIRETPIKTASHSNPTQPPTHSQNQDSNASMHQQMLMCMCTCTHVHSCMYQASHTHQNLDNSIMQTPHSGYSSSSTRRDVRKFFLMYLTLYHSLLHCHYQQNNKTTTNFVNSALNHTRYKIDTQVAWEKKSYHTGF